MQQIYVLDVPLHVLSVDFNISPESLHTSWLRAHTRSKTTVSKALLANMSDTFSYLHILVYFFSTFLFFFYKEFACILDRSIMFLTVSNDRIIDHFRHWKQIPRRYFRSKKQQNNNLLVTLTHRYN